MQLTAKGLMFSEDGIQATNASLFIIPSFIIAHMPGNEKQYLGPRLPTQGLNKKDTGYVLTCSQAVKAKRMD